MSDIPDFLQQKMREIEDAHLDHILRYLRGNTASLIAQGKTGGTLSLFIQATNEFEKEFIRRNRRKTFERVN